MVARVLVTGKDNLDVNADDPFEIRSTQQIEKLSTTDSGQWYNIAYCHKVKDPAKDFMIPIIIACDETCLRKGGKASSWPLLFTTLILNQTMRNLLTVLHGVHLVTSTICR
jgi:hypothetical protein